MAKLKTKSATFLDIKAFIKIGEDALQGKICNQCGREFRKAVGYIRLCKKCEEQKA